MQLGTIKVDDFAPAAAEVFKIVQNAIISNFGVDRVADQVKLATAYYADNPQYASLMQLFNKLESSITEKEKTRSNSGKLARFYLDFADKEFRDSGFTCNLLAALDEISLILKDGKMQIVN